MSNRKPISESEYQKDTLIANLLLEKMRIEREVSSLENALKCRDAELIALKGDAEANIIQKKWVSDWVVSLFESGRIPLPDNFAKGKKGLVKVTCDPNRIMFDPYHGIYNMQVCFDRNNSSQTFSFDLVLAPSEDDEHTKSQFASFHHGYEKIKPEKPASE